MRKNQRQSNQVTVDQIVLDSDIAPLVFKSIPEGVMVTDSKGTILSVNPAFTSITGYKADEVVGQTPRILNSGKHNGQFYIHMWASIYEQGHWQGEIWNKRKNGEVFLEYLTIRAIRDEQGMEFYIAVFSDITQRKFTEERIKYQAYHDFLTGLPNRLLFYDRLSQALLFAKRNHKMVSVMFLDLDHFKSINDSLGHDIGDLLLQEVANRLTVCLRESDTVTRLGGDEFAIIFPELKRRQDAAKMAQNIIDTLTQPYLLDTHQLSISTSIGISLYPTDGQDIKSLLKHADLAMYRAKQLGRNNYQFYTSVMGATPN